MDIKTIAARIRALRAKAADEASSMAEAMGAAAHAAKLLAKYDLTEAQIAADDSNDAAAVAGGFGVNRSKLHDVLHIVWSGIAQLTETKSYRDGGTLRFVGMPQDVEMAIYLSEMLTAASDRMWQDYRKKHVAPKGRGRSFSMYHRRGFMRGFGTEINARLVELATQRKKDVEQQVGKSAGTALVVRKQDLIKTKMDDMGLNLRKTSRRVRVGSDESHAYGSRAARTVNLGRPVEGANTTTHAIA